MSQLELFEPNLLPAQAFQAEPNSQLELFQAGL
jgi:hypothetical protein